MHLQLQYMDLQPIFFFKPTFMSWHRLFKFIGILYAIHSYTDKGGLEGSSMHLYGSLSFSIQIEYPPSPPPPPSIRERIGPIC